MIPYLLLFLLTAVAAVLIDTKGFRQYSGFFWCVIFIYVVLLVGLRFKVGADTLNYMEAYDSLPNSLAEYFRNWEDYPNQPFYVLLCTIARSISPQFFVFQLLHTTILNLCIFTFIRRYTEKPFIGLLFYFVIYFLYFNMEILKESLAIAVFLVNYKNLKEKKWVRYYLLVFVSVMFHISAVILLFFPFIRWIKLDWKFIVLLIGFIGLLKVSGNYLTFLENFEKIGTKVTYQIGNSENLNMNYIIFSVFRNSLLPLGFLILLKTTYLKKNEFESLVCLHVILGIGAIMYPIIFNRFTNYTTPFYALMLTFFFYARYKNFYHKFVTVCYFSIFILSTGYYYIHKTGTLRMYHRWIPYSSVLNPRTYREVDDFF